MSDERKGSVIRRRKPLGGLGGPIRMSGDKQVGEQLAECMRAASRGTEPEALTHPFHSYPARMHPGVARSVLQAFAPAGTSILDPFCGSGTVLIESMVHGAPSVGVDLNPLSVRLSRVKCQLREADTRERFLAALAQVAEASEARVRSRQPVHADLSPAEVAWYEGHTLKELAGLLEEIRGVEDKEDRLALAMVFSAIVTKFSSQMADTAERATNKRIRKGLPTEFFLRKGKELVGGWAALRKAVPAETITAYVLEGDARRLGKTVRRGSRFDLVLTSPPYGGTYDYIHHHARRFAWLGFDTRMLEASEIGARRHASDASAQTRWEGELREVLQSIRGVCRDDARLIMLMGDAQLAGSRIPADEQLRRLAPDVGFEFVSAASQKREDRAGGKPREEHLIALRTHVPGRTKRRIVHPSGSQ